MFKVLKGAAGDRIFRGATISALAILIIFFVGIIVSLLTYTDWGNFVSGPPFFGGIICYSLEFDDSHYSHCHLYH